MQELKELVDIYNRKVEQDQPTQQIESDILSNLDQQFISKNTNMSDQLDLLPLSFISHNFQSLFRQSVHQINHDFYLQLKQSQLNSNNRTVVRLLEKADQCLNKQELFVFVRTVEMDKKIESRGLLMCWVYRQILEGVESKYRVFGQVLASITRCLVMLFRKYVQFVQKNQSQQMKSKRYKLMQQLVSIMIQYILDLLAYFKTMQYLQIDDDRKKIRYIVLLFLGDLIEGCSGPEIKHYVKDIDNIQQQVYQCTSELQNNKMELVFSFVNKYRYNWINVQKELGIMDKEEYGIDDGLNPKMIWIVVQDLVKNENWELRYSRHYRLKVCCYLLAVIQQDKQELVKMIIKILGQIDINQDVYKEYDVPINGLFMQLIQFMGGPDNSAIKELNSTVIQGLIDRMDRQKRRAVVEYLAENSASLDLLGYLMFQIKQQLVKDFKQNYETDLLDPKLQQTIESRIEQTMKKQQCSVGFASEYSNYWLYLSKVRKNGIRLGILQDLFWNKAIVHKLKQMEDMVTVGAQQKEQINQWMIVNHTIQLIRDEKNMPQ